MRKNPPMRLLVVFHLYYSDQLDWYLKKMRNIGGCRWDLLVTGGHFDGADVAKIRSLKPDASFLECENAGYDVWPFIKAMKTVDLDAYDLVMKLHTKSGGGDLVMKFNGIRLRDFMWRDALVDALLGSRCQFRRVLHIFRHHPDAGMVCSRKLYIASHAHSEDGTLLNAELERLGLEVGDRRFCAGTMMVLRAGILKTFPADRYSLEDFPVQAHSHSGGTLAHVCERVLSLIVSARGYKIYTTGADLHFYLVQAARRLQPFFKNLFNLDRYGLEREKRLTLLGFWIPLEKKAPSNTNKKVVFTAISGGYDQLKQPRVVHPDWDYVCFTDVEGQDGVWKLRKNPFTEGSDTRRARQVKLQPHRLLPGYEWSVWMDANICITGEEFYRNVEAAIARGDLVAGLQHPWRDCVYDELRECYLTGRISFCQARRQLRRYKRMQMPAHYGLWETNVLLRRHLHPDVVAMDDAWHDALCHGTNRDQLTFTPVLSVCEPHARHHHCKVLQPAPLFGEGLSARNVPFVRYEIHLAGAGPLQDQRDVDLRVRRVKNLQ